MNGGHHSLQERYKEGMPGYVLRDWEIIDYECYKLEGTELWFRGPAPEDLKPGKYFSVIGAAQTFGCFCERPYPTTLAGRLGLPGLNLGYSGAGPAFFLRHPEVLDHVNRGAFCVVQVMSGRSTSNSLLENVEGLAYGRRRFDGTLVTAEAAFEELLQAELARLTIPGRRLKAALLRVSGIAIPAVRAVVEESRLNYICDYQRLMSMITVPKVLFWFSKRRPYYRESYHRRAAVLGTFPHFVNDRVVDKIAALADRYVQCVSRRGSPQPLFSRFTGEPAAVDLRNDKKPTFVATEESVSLYEGKWQRNMYYPSPEMHDDAAKSLQPAAEALLSGMTGIR